MLSLRPRLVSMIPKTPPPNGLVLATFWAQLFTLTLLCMQIRWHIYTWKQRKRFDEWILEYRKEIFAVNGVAVYPFLYFFEGLAEAASEHQPPSRATIAWVRVLLHVLCIPFAILLWDLGRIYGRESSTILLINLHHLGVFLALPFHITEDPLVAGRTTRLFGWMWLVHIFPWLIQRPLQLLIKSGATDVATVEAAFFRAKECYCMVTVVLVYDYFCGDSQPGFGWNYQTISLVTLWIGRFGYNQNFRRSTIFRRFEFPGSIVVVFSSLFFDGDIYRGAVATASFYASILLGKSVIRENRPGKWDPGHPSIEQALNDFERDHLHGLTKSNAGAADAIDIGRNLESQELLFLWSENQQTLGGKYPIARAIVENKLQNLEAIILSGGDDSATSIYEPMRELKNLTPGELAVSLRRIRCVVLLITKGGLDPWEDRRCDGDSIWALAKKLELHPLLDLKDRLESRALEAYPPVSSSIFDRAAKIIRSF